MYFSVPTRFALLGLTLLGGAIARPAGAQNLTYTLADVTFNDGAAASGYFDFNPTTQVFGPYDMTTTDGTSDSLLGAHYFSTASSNVVLYIQGSDFSDFGLYSTYDPAATDHNANFLVLHTNGPVTTSGIDLLDPGTITSSDEFRYSGEFAHQEGVAQGISRVIETGSLVVTPAAAVPEASTTVSFGLLLALGLGGVVVAAKRKKVSPAA